MNKANMQKWIDALESGKYKQTTGALADDSGYCCLGVACEIFNKETGKGKWSQDAEGTAMFISGADSSATELPQEVQNWLGVEKSNPELFEELVEDEDDCEYGETSRVYCIEANDDKGLTFKDIAQHLKEKLNGAE